VCVCVIPLTWVNLGISNLLLRLMVVSTSMIDYPLKQVCSFHVTFLNKEMIIFPKQYKIET